MIQKKAIESIYKKYKKRPASPDELDIPLLFEQLPFEAGVEIDGSDLVLGSVENNSPFHRIPVRNIHAIVNLDETVAIVLRASIIFISKDDGSVSVHLKMVGESIFERLLPFKMAI